MAITEVFKQNRGESGTQLDQQNRSILKRTRTDYYLCRSNSLTDTADTVEAALAAQSPPVQIGSFYNSNAQVVCTNIKSNRTKPYWWQVEVEYTTLQSGKQNQNNQNPKDPTTWRWEVQTAWVRRQKPLYIDVNGNAVINSVAEAIDPPPMVDDDILQIKVSRNELYCPLANMQKFKNVLNKTAFWGYPAGCLKMLPIIAQLEWQDNVPYWHVTYTVEATSGQQFQTYFDDWGIRPVDRGSKKWVDINGQRPTSATGQANLRQAVIVDFFGIPHQKPCLLDGHGQPLPANSSPVWVAFAANGPPPNGNRLSRANGNLVDGYQGQMAQDFSTLKDGQGRPLLDITAFAANAKVGW